MTVAVLVVTVTACLLNILAVLKLLCMGRAVKPVHGEGKIYY